MGQYALYSQVSIWKTELLDIAREQHLAQLIVKLDYSILYRTSCDKLNQETVLKKKGIIKSCPFELLVWNLVLNF